MDFSEERIDLTDLIANGNVEEIISKLRELLSLGFNKLYWDGYDASIHLYKKKEAEQSASQDGASYEET